MAAKYRWLWALCLLAVACTSTETVNAPTQIMLRISADRALREQLSGLRVSVALREGNDFKPPTRKQFEAGDLVWPVDIPILPRVPEDAFKEFEVVVDALDGTQILAQARTLSGFVPEGKRVLPLALFLCPGAEAVCGDPECSGERCQVCAPNGACVSVDRVDPNQLEPLVVQHDAGAAPIAPDGDAAAPEDAASPDTDGGATTPEPELDAARDGAASDVDAGRDAAPADATLPPVEAGGNLDASDGQLPEAAADAGSDGGAGPAFVPVRFSNSDREPLATALSADRLRIENLGEGIGNARSDRAISAGSGVFYFEAERLIDRAGEYGVGIATANAALNQALGHNGQSVGMNSLGGYATGGASCESPSAASQSHYGFVVDYRGAQPVLHVLLTRTQGPYVACSMRPSWTVPVYLFYSGARYEVGHQIAINAGSDTTNFPFHFPLADVRAALETVDQAAAAALVPGFGQTRALPLSATPVLSPPAAVNVAADSDVVLMGSASDAEDGDLTAQILWEDLSALHHAPRTARGARFSFRATLGRHPVRMSVSDSVGRNSSTIVMVDASGAVPTPAGAVKLVLDELADDSVNLDNAGLAVDFRSHQESGLRANQAIYGQYWYFEAQRLFPGAASISVGVMVRDGLLDPLSFEQIPWCASLHMTGLTAYNMNGVVGFPAENDRYGFAVDYRDEHPVMHIIVGGAPGMAPRYLTSITLEDVWTPVHPFISGVALDADVTTFEARLNFGASAFFFDPVSVLGSGRADGLQLGWGVHARTP